MFITQQIRSILVKLALGLSLVFMIVLYSFIGPAGILRENTFDYEKNIVIQKGLNLSQIADYLYLEGIVPSANSFLIATLFSGNRKKIKHGEFLIPKTISPWQVSELLASGKTVIRKLTLVEGQSVKQAIRLLESNPFLKGAITRIPYEGTLLPETYQYQYGDDRQKIINKMEKNMYDFISDLQTNFPNHPLLEDKKSLLTLASLIEKETSLPEERKLVSGVYINRLSMNMPLQCDPTVIYAITQGEKLSRPLLKDDLKIDSPYNTYKYKGLPIGPIACPGKASILAALSPEKTEALYFVANGKGGHNFSNTLQQHNNSVQEWRQIKKEQLSIANETISSPVNTIPSETIEQSTQNITQKNNKTLILKKKNQKHTKHKKLFSKKFPSQTSKISKTKIKKK